MTAETTRVTYTPAEYLKLERAAETKSEYLNGQIVAMTGASLAHNFITLNVGSELHRQLRGKACSAFVNDMRVRVSHAGLYTYPDVAVACEPLQFEDAEVDTLLNPVVIVEVLSRSTEAYDRGHKFAQYRRLESLQEYVLVAQDEVRVERFVRQGDLWVLSEMTDLGAVLSLDAIGCQVNLADIYERVELRGVEQPMTTAEDSPVTP